MENPLILVVDDEVDNRSVLESRLKRRKYDVIAASSGIEALKLLENTEPDLVLLDVMMPEMDGFETCKRIKELKKDFFLPIILLTAKDDKESRIKGFDIGADDYIAKPFDIDELSARIRAMLRIKDLKRELDQKNREITRLSKELKGNYFDQFVMGNSEAMNEVMEKIQGAAAIPSPVVITGESGTGKEMVAKGIHFTSPMADAPFVAVNCAALPEELIESELFGHKKGAFTGALSSSEGLFRAANGGTIFLDEITEMSRDVQAKLLRVLQEGTVRAVGSTEEVPISVRVIAATNMDLEKAVKDGRFREDLYYRINVLNIKLPPLRERKEDIPILAQSFINRFNRKFLREIKGLSEPALAKLSAHTWPGNVRELQNVIERCFAFPSVEIIDERHIQMLAPIIMHAEKSAEAKEPAETSMDLEEAEKRLILDALSKTGNNKQKAAKLLGIHRSRLYKKLERYGIKI